MAPSVEDLAPASDRLAGLLQHPGLWRGRSLAQTATLPTGYPALDAALPGGGWPQSGITEILIPRHGVGELQLLMPALAMLTHLEPARWCTFIAPPFEAFAPALHAQGLKLERLLMVRTDKPLWVLEQALVSGACQIALAWVGHADTRSLRRLGLATQRAGTYAVLFRPLSAAHMASPAALRLTLESREQGLRLRLIKSRGGARHAVDVPLP
ncbi:MAG: translesion DNA synthesis-associated protein ImuA [Steroidobacteraceae bacterium]